MNIHRGVKMQSGTAGAVDFAEHCIYFRNSPPDITNMQRPCTPKSPSVPQTSFIMVIELDYNIHRQSNYGTKVYNRCVTN